jgi:pimeloyl-ACP methyl ester carboxylesterase
MSTKHPCLVAEWHAGKPDAPALLLLHGFGGSHTWWERMMDQLVQDYQVYALDLRFRHSLPQMAQELLEWIHDKRLAHLSILGHSLGALLGMYCTAGASHIIKRLILVNPAFPIPERSLWQWLRTCQQAHHLSHNPPPKQRWHHSLSPQTCRVVLQTLRSSPIIAAVTTPTLVLWGDRDPLFPLTWAQAFLHYFQSAHLLPIEGGHSLMYEFPERITPAILRFLASDPAKAVRVPEQLAQQGLQIGRYSLKGGHR